MATETKSQQKKKKCLTPTVQTKNGAQPRANAIREKNQRAIELLRRWDNFTPQEVAEQKETWAFLKESLF